MWIIEHLFVICLWFPKFIVKDLKNEDIQGQEVLKNEEVQGQDIQKDVENFVKNEEVKSL